jgi:hypothetical protein
MRRAIALLVMIAVVSLLSVYVNSVRAAGQADPCSVDLWKYAYCHNGHSICTGDENEVRSHTNHNANGNPNCIFLGCCTAPD